MDHRFRCFPTAISIMGAFGMSAVTLIMGASAYADDKKTVGLASSAIHAVGDGRGLSSVTKPIPNFG